MRTFLCGFMDREAKLFETDAVCAAAALAAEKHDAFVATGDVTDLDAFMGALADWRRSPTYPFPPMNEARSTDRLDARNRRRLSAMSGWYE